MEMNADASIRRPITPEEFYLSKEACEQIEEDAYDAASTDDSLIAFVQAVADGAFEVGEIAKANNVPPERIYLAKDKLKKRYKALLKKRQAS